MVKGCCAVGCTNNSVKCPDLSWYMIPGEKESDRRVSWINAIKRCQVRDGKADHSKPWTPKSKYNYLCSAHFISGKKNEDPMHPDYVPSVFGKGKGMGRQLERAERANKRIRSLNEISSVPVCSSATSATPDILSSDSANSSVKDSVISNTDCANSVISDTYCAHSYVEEPVNDCVISDTDCANSSVKEPVKDSVICDTDCANPSVTSTDCDNYSATDRVSSAQMSCLNCIRLKRENLILKQEKLYLKEQNTKLMDKFDKVEKESERLKELSSRSIWYVATSNTCDFLTGLNYAVFLQLFSFVCLASHSNEIIPQKEQLLLTLVKLRYNVPFEFLAHLSNVSKTTMIEYFWKWINILHVKIGFMIKFQDRDNIFRTIPPVFKIHYPRLTSIIDCFEVFCESPRDLKARAQCYSSYKKHCTVKFFISCSPLGSINFLSRAYGGRASDVMIVRDSGFISRNFHLPGDQILADRGFTLTEDFATQCSAVLIMPSFTKGREQLPAQEVETSRKISNVRIHIERVIGLLKSRYSIMKGTLPIRVIQSIKDEASNSEVSSIDKIAQVCAALVNMGESIVYREVYAENNN